MGGADPPVNPQMGAMEWPPMVVNTGQEALAWSAATAGQAGSDATLAPSGPARATLAVSHATLAVSRATLAVSRAAIAVAQDDTALAGSGANLAGSTAALAVAAAIVPAAVNLLQITTVAARQRCHPTLSPLLLLSLFLLPRETSCSN